ncbi:NmrA family NAD(P)-binding protein [Brevibacillus centrosporus]|uniref:NmrA family NAD(P)-binding protein n=1 Tax=Brevibacillus centrosporus TaxID=54910 RepID=UPI003985ACAF
MSIAITGANGKLGTLILSHLLDHIPARDIIACVRNPQAMHAYQARGADIRFCDYDQPASLAQAFQGVSQLLLISSPILDNAARLQQHSQVIAAAKQASVSHILYTGFAFPAPGASSLADLHLATEQAILDTGIPFTFLRNALYMDFVGSLPLHSAVANGCLTVPPGDWRFNAVSRADLAKGIAAVLAEPKKHLNKTNELTASHPWTFHDLTAALSELSGKPLVLQENPEMESWLYGFLRQINTSSVSRSLEQLLGHPTTVLKESIRPFL